MSVDEKHFNSQKADEQGKIMTRCVPPATPNKRKFPSAQQHRAIASQEDDHGRQKFSAPKRKRRKRFSKAGDDDPQATPFPEVFAYYSDESDLDEVFDSPPSTASSSPEAVSEFSMKTINRQQTPSSAYIMNSYSVVTVDSESLVFHLITNMENFALNGSAKRSSLHNRRKRRVRVN